MTFSTVLDVAIGLVMVYLLMSLVCASLREGIEAQLKWRSQNLEKGIREMLTDSAAKDFYNHPLIFGLFEGKYDSQKTSNLPSYIPSRMFALAVMDLLLPANATNPSGAAGADVPPATIAPAMTVPPVTAPAISPALKPLRDKVVALLGTNDQLAKALLPLIDSAGNDIAKVRENIEGWFNSAMDRVSGWYKRNTQMLLLVLGLVVTIGLNVDSLAVARLLFNDKAAREALAAGAPELIKKVKDKVGETTQVEKKDEKEEDTGSLKNDEAITDLKIEEIKHQVKELTDLGLPLGWVEKFKEWRLIGGTWEPDRAKWCEAIWFVVWAIPGWLVTALAISLGAPFWFDVLNKFMAVRASIKPKEMTTAESNK